MEELNKNEMKKVSCSTVAVTTSVHHLHDWHVQDTKDKEKCWTLNKLLVRYSSWRRIVRLLAWIMRFVNLSRLRRGRLRRRRCKTDLIPPLTVTEYKAAERKLWFHAQYTTYREEVFALLEG